MDKIESVFEEENRESFNAVISDAVLSVPGVAKITKCTATDPASSMEASGKSRCDLELGLAVEYGSSIPAICDNIQKKLKEDVQARTGLEVKLLSLCIEDIHHALHE